MKELSKKLDMETKKADRDGAKVKELETECAALVKERGETLVIALSFEYIVYVILFY